VRNPRLVWLTVHRWIALSVGWVLALVGLMGAMLVVAQPLDRWAHPELFVALPTSQAPAVAPSLESIRRRLADEFGKEAGFTFRPPRAVDDTLWVVVGDLPSAYLALDDAPTWREALQGYVYEMGQWVSAVKQGDSLDDVIPVAVEPTIEHAEMLASRLAFIEEKILGVPDEDLESDA